MSNRRLCIARARLGYIGMRGRRAQLEQSHSGRTFRSPSSSDPLLSMAQTDTQSSCALDAFTKLKDQLSNVLASVHAYQHPVSKPPIIDACLEDRIDDVHRVDSVPGLRVFKESVRKDLDILSTVK
jgi:hypothetical protein